MRTWLLVIAVALPSSAGAQESPPSKGTGLIITGAILTGVGAVNLATLPLCGELYTEDSYGEDAEDLKNLCVYSTLIVGVGTLAVGVPLLVVGLNRRAEYRRWQEQHPAFAGMGVVAGPGGALLGWRTEF